MRSDGFIVVYDSADEWSTKAILAKLATLERYASDEVLDDNDPVDGKKSRMLVVGLVDHDGRHRHDQETGPQTIGALRELFKFDEIRRERREGEKANGEHLVDKEMVLNLMKTMFKRCLFSCVRGKLRDQKK
jgi:hypothetical protein